MTPLARIPCWHTMSFLLPEAFFNSILASCLNEKYFYYVLHPADLLDESDIPAKNRDTEYIYRLGVSLAEKTHRLNAALEKILKCSSGIITLEQIAKEIISTKKPLPI